jgi:small conductance mechanosensitive channel
VSHPQFHMSSRLLPCAAIVVSLLLLDSMAGAQTPGEEAPPKVPKVEQLLESVERLRSEYRDLQEALARAEVEGRTLIVLQMRKKMLDVMSAVGELVEKVVHKKQEGVKRPLGLNRTRRLLLEMDRTVPAYIDQLEADAAKSRTELGQEPTESHKDLLIGLKEINEILDGAYPLYLDHLERREALGLKAGNGRKQLRRRANERASMLAGRVELLWARRREAQQVAERSVDDAALQSQVRAANEELDAAATSLWAICDVMDDLGLETAKHRQVLIRATGEITGDVLDFDVLTGLFDEGVDSLSKWLDRRGPPLLARATLFSAILAFFWVLGRVVRGIILRLTDRAEHVSELSRNILVGVAARTVFVLGFFIALSQVGINVTALLTGLGIAGFIVGFALQDTLANFASGTMILLYRPFDVGDVIEAGGVYGNVDGMSLVSTTILTFDNQTMVVPNSKIWGDVIRNVTAQDTRRIDLEFGFSNALDVSRVEEILASILNENPKVLEEPESVIKIHKLTDLTARIVVRPWVKREDYWEVYWDLTREVKLRLDREGVPVGLQQPLVERLVGSSD